MLCVVIFRRSSLSSTGLAFENDTVMLLVKNGRFPLPSPISC